MTNIFQKTIGELATAGIESPRLETRMMIAFLLHKEPYEIGDEIVLNSDQQIRLTEMTARRIKHEPLDKILGYKDFYKHRFKVGTEVLTPRSDSEILVESAVKIARQIQAQNILELGVGSGCLILSILDEIPHLHGIGIDKSAQALAVAQANTDILGLQKRLQLVQCDYTAQALPAQTFDIIIANPPYIPSTEIASLDTEVRDYDPLMALDGGDDGLQHYRIIAEIITPHLSEKGYILLEGGLGQADDIMNIFTTKGLKSHAKITDLAGIERCIILKK